MQKKLILISLINLVSFGVILSSNSTIIPKQIVRGDPFLYNISLNDSNKILAVDKPVTTSVQIKSFSILNWGGSTATSYANTGSQTDILSGVGVPITMNNFIANTGQIRGSSTSTAESNFFVYNTVAIPGALRKITLKVNPNNGTFTTSDPTTRNLLFTGTSSQENVTSSTTSISVNESSSGIHSISWNINPSLNQTFFKIYHTHTFGTVLANLSDSITIEYEDFSSLRTEKGVDIIYQRSFFNITNHVSLGASINNNPGKIYNDATTQITSIVSVIATFSFSTNSGGELRFTSGTSGQPLGNALVLQSGVETTVNNNPYFFMLTNTGNNTVYLESFIIYYSCIEAEEDEYSGDLIEFSGVADPSTGFEFLYWKNMQTEKLVSNEPNFTGLVPVWANIQPVYRPIPDVTYSTGFDTSKSSYTRGVSTFDGKEWLFDQALTGNLENDLFNNTRSARLHGGGFIQTQFNIPFPAEISFLHGVFGSDTLGAKLALEFSQTGWDWMTLDNNIEPIYTLAPYTHKIDIINLYLEGLYDPNLPFYLRIFNQNRASSATGVRINIDDLTIKNYSSFTQFPLKQHQSNRLTFQFENVIQTLYEKGESFVADDACVAVDVQANTQNSCAIISNVNTSITGTYELIYRGTDVYGDIIDRRFDIYVLNDLSLLDRDYSIAHGEYYQSIQGLFGKELIIELRKLSYLNIQTKSYEFAKEFLRLSDVDPDNTSNAIAIYTGSSVYSEWDGGITWQREHVWPNSRLGARRVAEADRHIASDLYNLRFIEASVNSSRSNRSFNEDINDSNTYNPGADKGDVARIYFYMDVMYDWISMTDLILGTSTDTYTKLGAISGQKSYLLQAHLDDEVSTFELYRYQLLIENQGNRNPFIDYPDLIHLIYF